MTHLFFFDFTWNQPVGIGIELDRASLLPPKITGNSWRALAQMAIMAASTANRLEAIGRTQATLAAYTFAAGTSVANSALRKQMMPQTTLPGPVTDLADHDVSAIDELGNVDRRLCAELGRVIVGQHLVIEQLAICLFARGHGLLMGVPGLAKTLLVSKLVETMSLGGAR